MQRIKITAVIAALLLLAAACGGGDDTTAPAGPTGSASESGGTGALSEFGESIDADPALIDKALGPVEPSDEASWNIILAAVARADQDVDQATIDKAMECWSNRECDTGTGGEIVTWPRAVTVPVTVRFDCRFMTLTASPSVPFSSALPRMVR